MTETQRYRVYLLRLWQVDGDDGRPVWRAALEDARTGERHGFADLARLCAFLEAQRRTGLDATRINQRLGHDVSIQQGLWALETGTEVSGCGHDKPDAADRIQNRTS